MYWYLSSYLYGRPAGINNPTLRNIMCVEESRVAGHWEERRPVLCDQGAHTNIHGFSLCSLNIRSWISEKGSAISSKFGFMISTIDLRFFETHNYKQQILLCYVPATVIVTLMRKKGNLSARSSVIFETYRKLPLISFPIYSPILPRRPSTHPSYRPIYL